METETGQVIARRDGAIGWLILNNPARHNATSLAMCQAIHRIIDTFEADLLVRVLVVTGAGERAFTSGADISEFEEKRSSPDQIAEYETLSERASASLELTVKPTIAMIRGYCFGGGLDLALRCDLRIASEDARFAVPAVRLGLGYSFSDVKRLVDAIGPAHAKEILLTGRQFSAAEAFGMGLVHQVVTLPMLAESVGTLAEILANNAPLTIRAMKRCVTEAVKDRTERDFDACKSMVDACFASADCIEGRRAFMEKRQPHFHGH